MIWPGVTTSSLSRVGHCYAPDMPPTDLWNALLREVGQHVPEAVTTVRGPADPARLAEAEQFLGQALPDDLRAIYLQNDGQPEHTVSGLFYGMAFMPVEDSLAFARGIQQWHEDAPDLAEEVTHTSRPPGAVLPFESHPHWWPVASDGGGGYLALDFAPGPSGHPGQLIHFGSQDPLHVLAPSLTAFLEWYLAQLQAGNFRVTPAAGLSTLRLELAQPPRAMFPDAIGELYRSGKLPSVQN